MGQDSNCQYYSKSFCLLSLKQVKACTRPLIDVEDQMNKISIISNSLIHAYNIKNYICKIEGAALNLKNFQLGLKLSE